MPTRMRARTAPNEREQELLAHVVKAQRELEAALRLTSDSRRGETRSFQRKQAYGQIHRKLLGAANLLNGIQGTHRITDDPIPEPLPRVDRTPKNPTSTGEG